MVMLAKNLGIFATVQLARKNRGIYAHIYADNMIKANVRPDVNKVGRSKTNANKQTHAIWNICII
jgi:hypothetical protein